MQISDEAHTWLKLGYETYGPSGALAIAKAMGLPADDAAAIPTSGGLGRDKLTYRLKPSTREAPQSPASCPATPPRGASGWRPYPDSGDPNVFHCGFEGYLEDRRPSPDRPIAEYFYDEWGNLVDDGHPYANCKGTPDQHSADDWQHIWPDEGGVVRRGWDSFWESQRHASDWAREFRRHAPPRDLKGLRPFRAPLPQSHY